MTKPNPEKALHCRHIHRERRRDEKGPYYHCLDCGYDFDFRGPFPPPWNGGKP